MSTRANIILQETFSWEDEKNEQQTTTERLYFYRHSDGYPDGTMPSLKIFIDWVKKGKIRDNVSQSAGWLILIGAMEYNTIPEFKAQKTSYSRGRGDIKTIQPPMDWKCGAYEPTIQIHDDIEFLYIIDLPTKTIKCFNSWDKATGEGVNEVNIKKYIK